MGWTQRHVKNPTNGMPLSKQKNPTNLHRQETAWVIHIHVHVYPPELSKSSGDQSVKLNKVDHAVNTDSGQIFTRNGTLSL